MENAKLVVESTSPEEMLDFRQEVLEHQGINSYAILSAEPCRSSATNTATGDVSGNLVQCRNIDGGVNL